MYRKAACLVLCLLPAVGVPSEWTLMSSQAGVRLEFDHTTISRRGDTGTAWDRTVSDVPRATPASGDVAFHSVKTLVRYDCVRRTAEPIVRSFAFADGGEVLRQNVEGSELPQPVVPDTPRDRMLALVCAVKPKAEPKPPQIQTAILPGASEAPQAAKPTAKASTAKPAPKAEAPKAEASAAAKTEAGASKEATKASEGATPAVAKAAPSAEKAPAPAKAAAVPAPAPAANDKAKAPAPQPGKDAAAKTVEAPAGGKPSADAGHGTAGKDKAAKDAHGGDKHAAADKAGHDGKAAGKDKAEASAAVHAEAKPVHWTYDGVQQWHKLSKEYAACAEGKRQSPIDIREGVRVQLEPIKFNYLPSPLRIVNTGHTVEVAYQPGSSIILGETTYELVNFHFHHPAEERINGRVYEMAAHLLHKSKDGRIVMVAVLVIPGDENEFVRTLWNYLPLDVGLEENLASVQIDARQLLPRMRGYYTYMGSLTTPPCTEGVQWIVMRTPVQLSRTQIATFSRLYKMNARPVQAANGRLIKEVL